MSKLVLSDLANLENQSTAVAAINANSALTESALENTLSRDGTSPNQMGANLDMNSNHILNLPAPLTEQEPLRLTDLEAFLAGNLTLNINTTFASQAEAEAGTNNTKLMTPLRSTQNTEIRAYKTGIINCTATYANVSGTGRYTITPVTGSPAIPAALVNGQRFRFVAPETAVTGLIAVSVVGTSNGFVTVISPDGVVLASFFDIKKGGDYIVQFNTQTIYAPTNAFCLVSAPVLSSQAPHGTMSIAAADASTIAIGNFRGGGLLMKHPSTGSYTLCRIPANLQYNVFNDTVSVDGVAHSSLDADTFYYVYMFIADTGATAFGLDFGSTATGFPVLNEIGFLVKNNDATRTLIGYLYTKDSDISFKGSGNDPQVVAKSIYSSTRLTTQTGDISFSTTSSGYVDVPNAKTTIVIDAATDIPTVHGCIQCRHATADCDIGARFKVDGLSINGDGTTSVFGAFSPARTATIPKANGYVTIPIEYAQALATGWYSFTPQVAVIAGGGTGVFNIDAVSDAFQ